jgi:UDP-N-acetylmuramate dehydrogenase
MKDLRNYSLLPHNTFGIDARCQRFLEYASVSEAVLIARQLSQPFIIIGGGSNLLLTRDYEGTVVRSAITGMELLSEPTIGDVLVRVGSGEEWDAVVAHFVEKGWHGAENLSLIPGDVGAAAVQNIGAYGAEVCDIIERIEAISIPDGELVTIQASDCQYGYRQSRFKQGWKNRYLITHVTYQFSPVFTPRLDYGNIRAELERRCINHPTAEQLRQVIIDIRNAKLPDPQVMGNAGSFFMNPVVGRQQFEQLLAQYPDMPHYHVDDDHEKIPAGWMIEQCGWKGRSLGRAAVHDKQALVLVNLGGATGQEVVTLCNTICKDVRQKFGIDIHPEVNIV